MTTTIRISKDGKTLLKELAQDNNVSQTAMLEIIVRQAYKEAQLWQLPDTDKCLWTGVCSRCGSPIIYRKPCKTCMTRDSAVTTSHE